MNDILVANIRKARMEAEKEIVSENMMGIDFSTLLHECKSLTQLVCVVEEYGTHNMQFKKGEW